jgi:hypothetical protein
MRLFAALCLSAALVESAVLFQIEFQSTSSASDTSIACEQAAILYSYSSSAAGIAAAASYCATATIVQFRSAFDGGTALLGLRITLPNANASSTTSTSVLTSATPLDAALTTADFFDDSPSGASVKLAALYRDDTAIKAVYAFSFAGLAIACAGIAWNCATATGGAKEDDDGDEESFPLRPNN